MDHLLVAPKFTKAKVSDPSDSAAGGSCEGYASVFNNEDIGGDVMMPGCFTKTLKEGIPKGTVKFMDSHRMYEGTQAVVGLVVEGKEDDYGLAFKANFSKVQRAQDLRVKVDEKIIDSLSFGYIIVKADGGKWDEETGKRTTRYIKEVKLFEVSLVVWGMNPKAKVTGLKSRFLQNDPDPKADRFSILADPDDMPEIEDEIQGEPLEEKRIISPVLIDLHSTIVADSQQKRLESLRQLAQLFKG